jgi:hypothetical protein
VILRRPRAFTSRLKALLQQAASALDLTYSRVNPKFLTVEDHGQIKKLRRLTTLLPEGVFPGLDGHT